MKPSILLISLLSSIVFASSNDFNTKLSNIDLKFQQSGPSLELLDNYDVLIKEINISEDTKKGADKESQTILGKIYYKKALVELSLGKDLNSIENLIKSLELNPSNPVVKKNLLELCVKYGLKDRLYSLKSLFADQDESYLDALNSVNTVDTLVSTGNLTDLNEAINISPLDSSLRSKRIELTTQDIQKTGDYLKFLDLVDDMTSLIKTNPVNNLNYINELSEIHLFGLVEAQHALNHNKKCLHYDFDNSECKRNSKFINKYGTLLQNLSNFHKYFTYLDEKEENEETFDLSDDGIKQGVNLLLNPSEFYKIRRENDNFKTNNDYLLHRSKEFNKRYGIKYNHLELTVLKTLIYNAFINNDHRGLKTLIKQLDNIVPNASETFLPLVLIKVDNFIKNNQFQQATQLIQALNSNCKHSHHYQSRASKINAHNQQQQRQQRQYQQQQQQQQRQQYFQQQQQPKKPKNDYYKLLNISKDADQPTIRKAYREMTKQYHPDKYKGDLPQEEIDAKMAQINSAYEVLSDPELRERYDRGDDPNDHESGGGGGGSPFRRGNAHNPFGNGHNFMNFGGFGQGGGFKFKTGGAKFKDNRGKKRRSGF
ncbi:putative secreted protein [Wickerhamomyces ciferrii]|uniref:Secreted protein n=1 Tax=Wickerhamomyces ciferrii (strain ATCC 14091 / BCRC 22168 / CBS 111 / JCM 3599 / NBRC 0793 / NRRL Y-1031 F-60-10) TaxID=1206466 RepID=K0KEH9_WICCF|nr:uncharacterized protein BN7_176 [Wickerhamomyces ciferrii]CCH40642.1 putative secreted protein [Wickerhamomyces ciferrii]